MTYIPAATRRVDLGRHYVERGRRGPHVQNLGHERQDRGRGLDAEHGTRICERQRTRPEQASAVYREYHRLGHGHHGGNQRYLSRPEI